MKKQEAMAMMERAMERQRLLRGPICESILLKCKGYLTIKELVITGPPDDLKLLEWPKNWPKIVSALRNYDDALSLRLVPKPSSTPSQK